MNIRSQIAYVTFSISALFIFSIYLNPSNSFLLPSHDPKDVDVNSPDVWVPVGFLDTREDGVAAAQQDIKRGAMMFAMYGDVRGMNRDQYLALGITPFLMGCGIGGKGWEFWTAYNRTIINEMQSRGYNFGRWGLIQS